MVPQPSPPPTALVIGNYCHDILIKDGNIIGESLGGAASFISNVLDSLTIDSHYISKVGLDFAYSVSHPPITIPNSLTTLFHAYFSSDITRDRVLKRVHACASITPADLPAHLKFNFGLAVGVAGEILPDTLGELVDKCSVVFVDVQALIRVFDEDGVVKHVGLRESGFFHLLPKIGVLKASAEEAPFVDVDEVRKWCCVVVTDGKDGCRVYWKDGEMQVSPFPTLQLDPTGAGDSFLGGFVAGLIWGLSVPDAALLGNFFGSLTVGQIGIPKFDLKLLQRVKEELQRKTQCVGCHEMGDVNFKFRKSEDHEEFQALLAAARLMSTYHCQDNQRHPQSSLLHTDAMDQNHQGNNCQQELHANHVYEEANSTC